MVRNYKRKTERGSATPQLMQEAADFVRNKNISVRESAQLFGVHYSTLQRFIHKTSGNTAKNNTHVGYAKPRQVFTCEQEEELVSYLKTAAGIYFGLSPREVKELAFKCANEAKIEMPDNWRNDKYAGKDWFSGFMKRHGQELSIRPHPSSSTASEPLPSTSTAVGPQPAVASFITDQVETANVGESSLCPEKIMPHPKATPRKKKCNTGRKARKCAILTDTPERNALFAEAIKKKNKKNDVKEKKATKKRKQEFLHKVRSKKPVEKYDISSSDDEDWYCLICVEPYSNSRPREKWIQCSTCRGWSHEECLGTDGGIILYYICHNCESDDE